MSVITSQTRLNMEFLENVPSTQLPRGPSAHPGQQKEQNWERLSFWVCGVLSTTVQPHTHQCAKRMPS